MSEQRQRLIEDRMMRDTAKRLVSNDWRHMKGDVREKGIGARMVGRMQEGASGLQDDAKRFASENPGGVGGMVAFGAAAIAAWLFRDEIAEGFDRLWHGRKPSLTDRISEQTGRIARSVQEHTYRR